jgi:hypothetical protein
MEQSPPLLSPLPGLLHQPWVMVGDDCGVIGGMNEWQGKLKYRFVHHKSHTTSLGPQGCKAGD